jgi:hypothetical protein
MLNNNVFITLLLFFIIYFLYINYIPGGLPTGDPIGSVVTGRVGKTPGMVGRATPPVKPGLVATGNVGTTPTGTRAAAGAGASAVP